MAEISISGASPTVSDPRTAGSLLAQWRTLKTVKNDLIKEGVLTGDATTDQVISALRGLLPAEQFIKQPSS